MDYKKLGLKCGIEIHQQLDTSKLFCSCGTTMASKPKTDVLRKLRPVVGELGFLDAAAAQEAMKNKTFAYRVYHGETCLVEADCEPPHPLNKKALDITLTVASMLNCTIPDEVHVMRKTVIDGSNTTGFQRTALVGIEGSLETEDGKVGITNVCVEEDAAQILDRTNDSVTYGLDRLGIPLIEIGTDPDIRTPQQAKDVAQKIGMMLRSTGRVKRGLGTIRQDVNISIEGGARVEIKGAQDLGLIPTYVDYEVQRQLALIQLRGKLKQFRPFGPGIFDATSIFAKADSKITKGRKSFAIIVPKSAGMFKTKLTVTRTLGNEIAAYVREKSGMRGFIHTDEDINRYGLEKEFEQLRREMKAGSSDLVAVVSGEEAQSYAALKAIADRVNQLLDGVPKETRKALDDGNTEYMRPLPGAARMYPETDILPIQITPQHLAEIRSSLPETWEKMVHRFMKQYGINQELSRQVVHSGLGSTFEEITKLGVDPKFAAATITQGLRDLKTREAVPIGNIREEHMLETFRAYKHGKIQKESIQAVLAKCARNPDENIESIIAGFESRAFGEEELRTMIDLMIKEKPELLKKDRPEQVYMGLVMAKVKGKAPGSLIMRLLQEEISKRK